MRALALLLLAWPSVAGAESLAETHFSRNFCWEAVQGAADAERPDQDVTAVRLGRERAGHASAPGTVAAEIEVTFRSGDGRRETVAHPVRCRPAAAGLRCLMDPRAGVFEVEAQGDGLLLTAGEDGMTLEGRELRRIEEGEAFALRRCG